MSGKYDDMPAPVARAMEAADKLHEDTSVSIEETHSRLCGLREHVDSLIEAVECDINSE